MTKSDKSVLKTVTGTFRNISFSRKYEPHAGEHLAQMNIPHWLAKRDAAYERAVFLIKNSLVSRSPKKRQSTYTRILTLLDVAYQAHKRAFDDFDGNRKQQVDHIRTYFSLLRNIVSAGASLLEIDMMMASKRKNSIQSFVGNNGAENLKIIGITCMEDEKKLHESAMNLIKTVEHTLEKEEHRSQKNLTRIDKDRYDKAFAELKDIYKREES